MFCCRFYLILFLYLIWKMKTSFCSWANYLPVTTTRTIGLSVHSWTHMVQFRQCGVVCTKSVLMQNTKLLVKISWISINFMELPHMLICRIVYNKWFMRQRWWMVLYKVLNIYTAIDNNREQMLLIILYQWHVTCDVNRKK